LILYTNISMKKDFNLKILIFKLMNNLLLIHVGCEVILLGGMAFYFQTQISGLKKQVAELKTQNGELIDAINGINDQMEMLYQQLNVIFNQQRLNQKDTSGSTLLNDLQSPDQPQKNLKPKPPVPKQLNKPFPKQTNKTMPQINKSNNPVLNKKPKKDPAISGSDYETLDEKELDKELQQEYKELEECEGGVCKLNK